jgi:hypothetical protein
MSAPYFVETLARNGDVLHRHQVDALPIRLGRGYDNDFIIDDDHCAARHAIIESDQDGRMVLRDLGTKNGVVHQGKRKPSLVMSGDTVVRLGHTTLRVRAADFPVPAEQLDRTRHAWEGGMPGLIGMFLIGVVGLVAVWLNDTQSFQLIRYLQALAYGIGAGLVWGGAWAFANRLFGRHARLGRHLFIFGAALASVLVVQMALSVLAYSFSLEWFTRYGSHLVILMVAGMLYFHLSTVKPNSARRFAVTCLMLALLGSGLTLISNEQRSGRLRSELFMSVLLPPSMRVAKDHNVDEFMVKVGGMQARLDAERVKKVKDNGVADDDDD